MEGRYNRNRIYILKEEQKIIKEVPILLAGSGIGSVIAECALRFGFENITIIDGDQVELSNLNRQNYIETDIHIDKVEALQKRLKSINKDANISIHRKFLNSKNVKSYIKGHEIAVNALDFSSDIPLVFDSICQEQKIPVLHPYNLGWGSLVAVITPDSVALDSSAKPNQKFDEIQMVKYISGYLKFEGHPQKWIDEALKKYLSEDKNLSPPQLSVGSWMVAGMCTHLLFNIATKRKIKKFPAFYFSSIFKD